MGFFLLVKIKFKKKCINNNINTDECVEEQLLLFDNSIWFELIIHEEGIVDYVARHTNRESHRHSDKYTEGQINRQTDGHDSDEDNIETNFWLNFSFV